jgi:hypothetical protein
MSGRPGMVGTKPRAIPEQFVRAQLAGMHAALGGVAELILL